MPLSRSDPKHLRVFNLHGIKVDRTRQRSQKMVAEARRDHRSFVICQICLNDSRNVLYILNGRLVRETVEITPWPMGTERDTKAAVSRIPIKPFRLMPQNRRPHGTSQDSALERRPFP